MKKIIVLTLMMILIPINFNRVHGEEFTGSLDVTCTDTNLLTIPINLESGITSFTLKLPATAPTDGYLKAIQGGYTFNFDFRDGVISEVVLFDTVAVDKLIVYDYSGGDDPNYLTEYIINYDAYNIPSNVDSVLISLPVTSCATGVIDQIEADGYYTYTYDELDYGRMAFAVYPDLPVSGDTNTQDKYVTQHIEIPINTKLIDLYVSLSLGLFGPDDFSKVYYYDGDMNLIFTDLIANDTGDDVFHQWLPYAGTDKASVFNVAWEFWGYDVSNTIKYIQFEFYSYNNDYALAGAFRNTEFYMYYLDNELLTVNWVIDGEIDKTKTAVIGGVVRYMDYPPVIEGVTFSHWIDSNGNIWDNTAITTEMVNNDIVNIYAIYIETKAVINPDIDDPTPDGGNFEVLLNDVGFNDAPERVIVFALIILLVSIVLIAKGVALFNIIIVDGIITAFFISLGLLPSFVTIIIVIVLVFLAYKYIMSGGGSYE